MHEGSTAPIAHQEILPTDVASQRERWTRPPCKPRRTTVPRRSVAIRRGRMLAMQVTTSTLLVKGGNELSTWYLHQFSVAAQPIVYASSPTEAWAALDQWSNAPYDNVVLDAPVLDSHGLGFLVKLRNLKPKPLVLLVAENFDTSRALDALSLGAIPVPAPTNPEQFLELRCFLHRRARTAFDQDIARALFERVDVCDSVSAIGDVPSLASRRRPVEMLGRRYRLRKAEVAILTLLVESAGECVPLGVLAESLLGRTDESAYHTVRVHIANLRKNLGDSAHLVRTVPGVGYRFGVNVSSDA